MVPFTEMGKGGGGAGAGKEWVGHQEPCFGLVQCESLLDMEVKMSRRQLDLCLGLSRKVRAELSIWEPSVCTCCSKPGGWRGPLRRVQNQKGEKGGEHTRGMLALGD